MVVDIAQSDGIDNFLAHYGVEGMHWGVRHDRGHEGTKATTRKIAKLDKKWTKNATSHATYFKIYNAMAEKLNSTVIDEINNHADFKGKQPLLENADGKYVNPSLADKYLRTYSNRATELLNQGARDHGLSASGKGLVFSYDVGKEQLPQVGIVQIGMKHADSLDDFDFKVAMKDGYIVGITVSPKSTVAHAELVDNFLAHYGVLGMHWGKRKATEPKQTRAQKKKAVAAERKANHQAARKAGYTPTMRSDDLHQVYLNGVRRIEKNVADGKTVAAARIQEYSRATVVGLGIGAGILAIKLSPILLRKANVGLGNLASTINAKRGAKVAADLFADSKGLTSYSTVALAFDKAKGVWA